MRAKDLIDNALLRELIAIRIDTMWRMLALGTEGRMPGSQEEGATGIHDNKGALFVPGGLIFDDSDRKPIPKKRTGKMSAREFRRNVRDAMQNDNATLLYPDGIATGVNLDNGFFADIASHILANKHAAMKRRPALEANPSPRLYSDDVTRSHVPTYLEPSYGSRTKLSSCIAVCLMEPRLYFIACRKEFGLRDKDEEARVWDDIRRARKPVLGKEETLLAPPYVVVCHTTRYRDRNLGGLTRILGYGKFGEFATLTFERVQANLLAEAGLNEANLDPRYILAEQDGVRVTAVLRMYAPTKPGKRKKKTSTYLVAPEAELGINEGKLGTESRERYGLD